jgi:flavin-binding protein dodecin
MSVIKVIEIMAESPKSFEDATKIAIDKASQSVDGIQSAWIQDQSVHLKDGVIDTYRVNCKISFAVH